MKKKLNEKGSILQIVLVVFLLMTFALTSCLFMTQSHTTHYQYIDRLMKQKNLEISLISYYVSTMENDLLISDSFEGEDYDISYTVDDLGDIYEIVTYIKLKKVSYSFLVDIETSHYEVKKLEYTREE